MLFTFEGVEGSGKTSIVNQVYKILQDRLYNEKIILTKEPGSPKSVLTKNIRKIIFDFEMDPITEAYLYAADRNEHVQTVILPNMDTIIKFPKPGILSHKLWNTYQVLKSTIMFQIHKQ